MISDLFFWLFLTFAIGALAGFFAAAWLFGRKAGGK